MTSITKHVIVKQRKARLCIGKRSDKFWVFQEESRLLGSSSHAYVYALAVSTKLCLDLASMHLVRGLKREDSEHLLKIHVRWKVRLYIVFIINNRFLHVRD